MKGVRVGTDGRPVGCVQSRPAATDTEPGRDRGQGVPGRDRVPDRRDRTGHVQDHAHVQGIGVGADGCSVGRVQGRPAATDTEPGRDGRQGVATLNGVGAGRCGCRRAGGGRTGRGRTGASGRGRVAGRGRAGGRSRRDRCQCRRRLPGGRVSTGEADVGRTGTDLGRMFGSVLTGRSYGRRQDGPGQHNARELDPRTHGAVTFLPGRSAPGVTGRAPSGIKRLEGSDLRGRHLRQERSPDGLGVLSTDAPHHGEGAGSDLVRGGPAGQCVAATAGATGRTAAGGPATATRAARPPAPGASSAMAPPGRLRPTRPRLSRTSRR